MNKIFYCYYNLRSIENLNITLNYYKYDFSISRKLIISIIYINDNLIIFYKEQNLQVKKIKAIKKVLIFGSKG